MNTSAMAFTPKAIQDLLDELEASRSSRRRAWENLQEIRWLLKDSAGMELPAPARSLLMRKGRLVNFVADAGEPRAAFLLVDYPGSVFVMGT